MTALPEGARSEFERLLTPALSQAWGTAVRLTGNTADAEDLLQDAALLAFRGFGSFRPESNFKAWFFRILVNRFYSNARRTRRSPAPVSLDDTPERYLFHQAEAAGLVDPTDAARRMMDRFDRELIERALEALPEDFRTVAVLYFTQDLSYQEIADIVEVPIGTVRSRLHRARRMLQKALWDLAGERGLARGPAPAREET